MLNGTCCSTPAYSSRFMGREKSRQRGREDASVLCVCVTDIWKCSHAFRNEMYKKVKTVKEYQLPLSRGFRASGKQHDASRWTGQQEPGNWQPTCGRASRQQTPGSFFVNQPAGAWYRAESRWMGWQPGWIPGSCSGSACLRAGYTEP